MPINNDFNFCHQTFGCLGSLTRDTMVVSSIMISNQNANLLFGVMVESDGMPFQLTCRLGPLKHTTDDWCLPDHISGIIEVSDEQAISPEKAQQVRDSYIAEGRMLGLEVIDTGTELEFFRECYRQFPCPHTRELVRLAEVAGGMA